MEDLTEEKLLKGLAYVKDKFNENGYYYKLLTEVEKRLLSIPIEPPVKPANGGQVENIKEIFDTFLLDVETCEYINSLKFENKMNTTTLILLALWDKIKSRLSV